MVEKLFSTSGIRRASNKREIIVKFYHKLLLFQLHPPPPHHPKQRGALVLMSFSLPQSLFLFAW